MEEESGSGGLPLRSYDDVVEFTVYLKPESGEEKLALEGGEIVFYTREPPVAGRPIAALRRIILSGLGIHSKNLEIVDRGSSAVVRIREASVEYVEERLRKLIVHEG